MYAILAIGGTCVVMIFTVGNKLGDWSSKPARCCLHFPLN